MMRIIHFIAICVIVIQPFCVEATLQELTPMIYQGTNHFVYGFHPSREMMMTFLEKRQTLTFSSSSNGKGFWEELEIREDKLFVTYLDVYPKNIDEYFGGSSKTSSKQWKSQTKEMFGVDIPTNGLFAVWFTGQNEEPLGERILLMSHVTERIRIYSFEKGVLFKVEERDSDYSIEKKKKELNRESANNAPGTYFRKSNTTP